MFELVFSEYERRALGVLYERGPTQTQAVARALGITDPGPMLRSLEVRGFVRPTTPQVVDLTHTTRALLEVGALFQDSGMRGADRG